MPFMTSGWNEHLPPDTNAEHQPGLLNDSAAANALDITPIYVQDAAGLVTHRVCPVCALPIAVTKHGSEWAFNEHVGSTRCNRIAARANKQAESVAAASQAAAVRDLATRLRQQPLVQTEASLPNRIPTCSPPRTPTPTPSGDISRDASQPDTPAKRISYHYIGLASSDSSQIPSDVVCEASQSPLFARGGRDVGLSTSLPPSDDESSGESITLTDLVPDESDSDSEASRVLQHLARLPRGNTKRRASAFEESTTLCKGVLIEWKAGSVWDSYPFQIHPYKTYGWEPIAVENDNWIRLRSLNCTTHVQTPAASCASCLSIMSGKPFRAVVKRAEHAPAHTPWKYLTTQQLVNLLRKMSARQRRDSLKMLNLARKLGTLSKRTSDHQRLVMLLANHDIKRLRQLLAVALRRHASPRAIVSKLEAAVAGVYNVRGGYTERELDIAFLVKAIGAPRLLYILQKSHGLVSNTTIRRHRPIPQLTPSAGVPKPLEIDANITTFFGEDQKPPRPKCGHSVLIDGIAIEEKGRYCRRTNEIVGLCREHSHLVDVSVRSIESVKLVADAVHGEDALCHYGKDATVVVIAPFRHEHYGATPVIVSPSCKAEKGIELAEWVTAPIARWREHPDGEARHGPIWSLASDGKLHFAIVALSYA